MSHIDFFQKKRYISPHMPFNPIEPHDLALLPPSVELNKKILIDLIIKARAELGELKGYTFSMPNPTLLLSPAIIKESLASSEIENINTTIINVMENQLFPEDEQKAPDKEVLRYRDAVMDGFDNFKKFSLTTRTILNIQKVLLPQSSGEYRRLQNGIQNNTTRQVIYTPPMAAKIPALMSNLEAFMNSRDETIDPLIKCAIAHYQFEAIHPFADGNGRAGRILMVLYLVNSGVLTYPTLFISGYINSNKSEYYKLLLEITSKGNWDEYLLFMMKGFYLQAKETKQLLFEIMTSFFKLKEKLKKDHKIIYSADLVEALISYPVITPVKLSNELEVGWDTASKYLKTLTNAGILADKKIGKYHLFVNKELINIIHK